MSQKWHSFLQLIREPPWFQFIPINTFFPITSLRMREQPLHISDDKESHEKMSASFCGLTIIRWSGGICIMDGLKAACRRCEDESVSDWLCAAAGNHKLFITWRFPGFCVLRWCLIMWFICRFLWYLFMLPYMFSRRSCCSEFFPCCSNFSMSKTEQFLNLPLIESFRGHRKRNKRLHSSASKMLMPPALNTFIRVLMSRHGDVLPNGGCDRMKSQTH